MKKIFFASAFALLMIVGGTSCTKTCHCKTYLDGEVISESEYTLEEGHKCTENNALIGAAGHESGLKCR